MSLGFFDLPERDGYTARWVFNNAVVNTASEAFCYEIPQGHSWVAFYLFGGGGGGGGGFSAAAGNARGGGGGGGHGGTFNWFGPRFFDRLYVRCGNGGAGGGAGAAGTAGTGSFISINNPINAASPASPLLLSSTLGNGGGAGTGSAGGTAQSTSGPSTQTYQVSGVRQQVLGGGVGTGGAQTGAVGASLTLIVPLGNGCGGAGTQSADFAGGGYVGTANTPFLLTIPGGAAGSNNGVDGFALRNPFICYGGTGGGSSNNGVGGNGGNGGFPGGGGGGGGGGTTGGSGGRGGDGAALIISW